MLLLRVVLNCPAIVRQLLVVVASISVAVVALVVDSSALGFVDSNSPLRLGQSEMVGLLPSGRGVIAGHLLLVHARSEKAEYHIGVYR